MAYRKRIDKEFANIIKEITSNEKVNEMKKYKQHYDVSTYEHCIHVSYMCYVICKKLKLDYISAARAGMLHDLFLYDWRVRQPGRKGFHAFTHGKLACKNASKLFDLTPKEKNMIITHMWPVTLQIPSSLEGFILTFVDKYCAISETFNVIKSRILMKKAFRYAYIFMSLLIIRF